jgi:phytol kinase
VLCWLLFQDTPSAPYLAALVPLAITFQFLLVGMGVIKDEAAVQAMSRSGDRREILRGPLYYGIVFVVLTIVFWLRTPVGIIALMLLCGGDGLAEIFGRRFGARKLPWNAGKSWAGSLGMFLGGWIFAIAVIAVYLGAGIFSSTLGAVLPAITIIALVGTAVESLPVHDLDNITVTLAAVLVGLVLL